MEEGNEKTAAYIGVGDELLAGSIQDTNFLYLARTLHELGIRLLRGVIIPDDLEAIRETLAALRYRATYVFVSGGLGPTHDDMTVEGVAQYLGVQVIRDPILEKKLREYFGENMDESSLKMASVPEGASLHFCDHLLIPVLSVDNIYLFPGIPELFRQKLDSIKERFRTTPFWTEEVLCTQFESDIADILLDTLEQFPTLKIRSYPSMGAAGYSLKIVLESKDRTLVEKAVQHLRSLIS